MIFTDQELEKALEDSKNFKPFAHYDSENDSLEFLASNKSFYAESIDPLVTVYYAQDNNELVGLRMKKVKKFFREFLKNAPGFRSEIHDHRILVEHLFTAKIWSSGTEEPRVITYRRLRDVAKEDGVEVEINDLAELAC